MLCVTFVGLAHARHCRAVGPHHHGEQFARRGALGDGDEDVRLAYRQSQLCLPWHSTLRDVALKLTRPGSRHRADAATSTAPSTGADALGSRARLLLEDACPLPNISLRERQLIAGLCALGHRHHEFLAAASVNRELRLARLGALRNDHGELPHALRLRSERRCLGAITQYPDIPVATNTRREHQAVVGSGLLRHQQPQPRPSIDVHLDLGLTGLYVLRQLDDDPLAFHWRSLVLRLLASSASSSAASAAGRGDRLRLCAHSSRPPTSVGSGSSGRQRFASTTEAARAAALLNQKLR
mmetsp:Transcript_27553/g.91445  ORF Transcript_27553/g.91445 Transcript_27553/m.91445 type:complete len:297 (+) Transcript_27553:1633-2523(+)